MDFNQKTITLGLPADEYHKHHAFGSTDAKIALRSLQALRDIRNGVVTREQSDSMALGSYIHCCLLEPHLVDSIYAVAPEGLDFRTKEGKAWNAANEYRKTAKAEWVSIVNLIKARIPKEVAVAIEGEHEASAWVEINKVPCKARYDIIGKGGIVDLKTTRSFEAFKRDSWALQYTLQAGWYRTIARLCKRSDDFAFLVVETESPWRSAMFVPTDAWIKKGDTLASDARCALANYDKPDVPVTEYELDVPPWERLDAGSEF